MPTCARSGSSCDGDSIVAGTDGRQQRRQERAAQAICQEGRDRDSSELCETFDLTIADANRSADN
jgi:hypothetical protein